VAFGPVLKGLNQVLAGLYPTVGTSQRPIAAAGLNPGLIAFSDRALDNWFQILREADSRNRVPQLIDAALEDYPEHPGLLAAQAGQLEPTRGPEPGTTSEPWLDTMPVEQLEKQMEQQSSRK
jgi:hypothetical protein